MEDRRAQLCFMNVVFAIGLTGFNSGRAVRSWKDGNLADPDIPGSVSGTLIESLARNFWRSERSWVIPVRRERSQRARDEGTTPLRLLTTAVYSWVIFHTSSISLHGSVLSTQALLESRARRAKVALSLCNATQRQEGLQDGRCRQPHAP